MGVDLLLVNAADTGQLSGLYPYPPLGLAYIAASVRDAGFSVAVEDLSFIPAGDTFAHFGEVVKRTKSDVVGIYGLSQTRLYLNHLAEMVKERKPETFVAGGGPHLGFTADEYLKKGGFDGICRREGEQAMVELMQALKGSGGEGELDQRLRGLKGWCFNLDGKIVHNSCHPLNNKLDELPYPAWDLFDIPRYFKAMEERTLTALPVTTSRGCRFGCMFCAGPAFMGRKVRYRSPQNVLSEVEWLYRQFDPQLIQFVDDTFTSKRERALEIVEGMGRIWRNPRWTSSITVSTADFELLSSMKENGCRRVEFGVESASEKVRADVLGKQFKNEDIFQVAQWLKDLDIPSTAYFIMGLPGETIDNLRSTNQLAFLLDDEYGVKSVIIPGTTLFPGTKALAQAKRQGLIPELTWTGFSQQSYMLSDLPILDEPNVGAELIKELSRELDTEGFASLLRMPASPSERYLRLQEILIRAKYKKPKPQILSGEIGAIVPDSPKTSANKPPERN